MAGFRLRCVCGEWVQVPGGEETPPLALTGPSRPLPTARARTEPQLPVVPVSEPRGPKPLPPVEVTDFQLADYRVQRREHTRVIAELILLALAFFGPHLYVLLAYSGQSQDLMIPLASLAGAAGVVLECLLSPSISFEGLRKTGRRYYLQALWTAAAVAFLAWWIPDAWLNPDGRPTYLEELHANLGTGLVLFVLALMPAIFEELAFRG
ncbi:MAG: hypothetical protein R3F33_06770 [Planctomycetota bacterium]